jgi:hypothetical protein
MASLPSPTRILPLRQLLTQVQQAITTTFTPLTSPDTSIVQFSRRDYKNQRMRAADARLKAKRLGHTFSLSLRILELNSATAQELQRKIDKEKAELSKKQVGEKSVDETEGAKESTGEETKSRKEKRSEAQKIRKEKEEKKRK